MSLENALEKHAVALTELTAAINSLIQSRISAPVSGTSTAAAAAKESVAKPETVKEKVAPTKAKDKSPEAEQLDAMKEVIEEAGEPEFPELPAGTRDEAYGKKHVTPVFVDLAKITDRDFTLKVIGSFKKADGTPASNSLEIQTKEWDKAVFVAKQKIAEAKTAAI